MVEISIEAPLSWNLSKNKKFIGRTKKVLNPDYVNCKRNISALIYRELLSKGIKFETGKIWLIITVIKKNRRGDCINLIEGIADAIKTQIDIDDNNFSVVTDWFIDTKEKILITVRQDHGHSIAWKDR